MAIAINGSGTVTGISVGGLPDGIVDADMLAANAVVTGKITDGTIISADLANNVVAFSSYAYLYERQHTNTDGGSATGGDYSNYDVRVLNNEEDPDSIVSLASNQFTLGAGTYFIQFCVPGYNIDVFNAKLYNTTDSSDVKYTNTMRSDAGADNCISAWGAVTVTISGDKTFEIRQHNQTAHSNAGLGLRSGYSENTGSNSSIYTQVWIFKT